MQIKNLSSSEIKVALNFLYNNARNQSSSKNSEDIKKPLAKDNGKKVEDICELDLCMNDQYDAYFIKVFYYGSTKAYRFSFSKSTLPQWLSFWLSWIDEVEQKKNPFTGEEESPWK